MKIMSTTAALITILLVSMSPPGAYAQGKEFEAEVAGYVEKFPYQDTYNYGMNYTGGDPAKLNVWILGAEPALVKAGEDKVVRMNNDTFYKMAFMLLDQGPVTLASTNPSNDRFISFQLMDDHNVNFANVIQPDGEYTLYFGEKPSVIQGETVEVPSALAVVIVRVEVKDLRNAQDMADAEKAFNGITIRGPAITDYPQQDYLGAFDQKVADEALKRIDETFATSDFSELAAGPDDVPEKVSYLELAAGTKGGWGAPVTTHSAYETISADGNGEKMIGSKGTYTITTEAPPVDAFWSITAYDTERGGFFHPNKDDRYHINDTAAVKSDDGTVTFQFKTSCMADDVNCLEVPKGQFDYVVRYYLPKLPIRDGSWRMSKAVLQAN